MSRTWWIKRLAFVWVALLFGLNYIAYSSLTTDEGRLLDLRPFGYSFGRASDYTFSLSYAQRLEYGYAYVWLDYVFIACSFAILLLNALDLIRPWQFITAATGTLFVLADLVENAFLWRTLMSPAFIEFDPWRVTLASTATQLKFAALTVAVISALIGWRRKEQR